VEYPVALAQLAPHLGAVEVNRELAAEWLRRAAAEDGELVVAERADLPIPEEAG
jgi:predicted amidohydrolase